MQSRESIATVVVGARALWIDLQRAAEQLQGSRRIIALQCDGTEQLQCLAMPRLQAQGLLTLDPRLLESRLPMQGKRLLECGSGPRGAARCHGYGP